MEVLRRWVMELTYSKPPVTFRTGTLQAEYKITVNLIECISAVWCYLMVQNNGCKTQQYLLKHKLALVETFQSCNSQLVEYRIIVSLKKVQQNMQDFGHPSQQHLTFGYLAFLLPTDFKHWSLWRFWTLTAIRTLRCWTWFRFNRRLVRCQLFSCFRVAGFQEREKVVFKPSFFRGELLNFGGCTSLFKRTQKREFHLEGCSLTAANSLKSWAPHSANIQNWKGLLGCPRKLVNG